MSYIAGRVIKDGSGKVKAVCVIMRAKRTSSVVRRCHHCLDRLISFWGECDFAACERENISCSSNRIFA